MPDSLAAFFARSLPDLVLFLLFSAPPLAGWWLYYRLPLGRRRFTRQITIPAPAETVWRLLDPRGPRGGWDFLHETPRSSRKRRCACRLRAARAFVFGGAEDLLIFGLMFLALDWFNRKRPALTDPMDGPRWRRLAVAAGLALVVGLYAHEADLLRQIRLPAAPITAPERA